MSGFVHLHCHSTWSLLDGAIPAEALPHVAAALGCEAVALTDHDSLLGAVRFTKACRDAGVKPIFGAELTVRPEPPNGATGPPSAGADRGRDQRRSAPPREHVTVIARDRRGYANLCRLITHAHLGNERGSPATTFEALAERSHGLFVLSGCERGEVARLAAAGDIPAAVAAARRWRRAIGESYRIEVFDHLGYGHRTLRDRLLQVSCEAGVPAVVSNDVHYANPEHAGTHELLHSIKEIVPLSRTHALRPNSEYFFKDPAEMHQLFADVPEALAETARIAADCDFDLELGTPHFPDVPIPPGETPTGRLARLCYEGARRRFGVIKTEVEDRLQHELALIFRMGFATPFLLVADIVDHVRRVLGIRCACRGSAAGSLVCYVLGISDVDPVRYDLLFERFMNDRREELPDIDVDVESHRREEVLEYVLKTYGAEQTAVCCMVDTFRARMAIREVGKALGLPAEEIDVVAKAFPRVRAADIPRALEHLPELRNSNVGSGQLRRLFELCYEIDGFPRHLALHPSGVILSSPDLADRVPMQESFGGFTMLQADKDDAEELGLIKLDVLGVRMLSALSHAVDEVERLEGAPEPSSPGLDGDPPLTAAQDVRASTADGSPSEAPLRSPRGSASPGGLPPGPPLSPGSDGEPSDPGGRPFAKERLGAVGATSGRSRWLDAVVRDDPATFTLIRSSRTLGCFQIESPGQRELIARMQPNRFEDLIIDISLFRPGPVRSDMVTPFLNRRHGFAEVGYPHDSLRSILAETHGVIVFHEQVIRVIAAVTGCSLDDADHVRRHLDSVADGPETPVSPVSLRAAEAVGSSPAGERDLREWFLSAAARNGYSSAQAAAVWAEVSSFAAFGFCKSHAAAFALPTYLSAWMKAHYPAEFFAGLLAHDPGMYPLRLIVADARRFGIPILPIDVNRSDAVPRVERCSAAARSSGAGRPDERPGSAPPGAATGEGHPLRSAAKGVRLALSEVRDISEAEIDSLLDGRRDKSFDGLEDLWRRAALSRPVLDNLIHVGALDEIAGGRSRRELLWRAAGVADKNRRPEARVAPRARGPAKNDRSPIPRSGSEDRAGQLVFDLDEPVGRSLPELPGYTPREETEAELEVSGIDARHHLMDHYRSVVEELGCVPARDLVRRRNDSLAWVAGVKVSTQTPAIRSGQRIIFLTLDDLTGPLDVTIFERVQPRCAHTVFHSWLLAVRGVVRKRGGASRIHRTDPNNVGVTVVAEETFDLARLASDRREGLSLATALGRQRRLQSAAAGSGAGTSSPPSKLWHASGGSAGR